MTNHARIGGILTIISGAFGILGGFGVLLGVLIMRAMSSMSYTPYGSLFPAEFFTIIMAFYAVWGIFLGLLGVLGIVGGVFALRKKNWGVALAGAIAGTLTFLLCGVPAVIFVTLAKPEFSTKKPARRRRR
jgi:hypothetical protein